MTTPSKSRLLTKYRAISPSSATGPTPLQARVEARSLRRSLMTEPLRRALDCALHEMDDAQALLRSIDAGEASPTTLGQVIDAYRRNLTLLEAAKASVP